MRRLSVFLAALLMSLLPVTTHAQGVADVGFDAGWFPAVAQAKIGVVADGVYRVTGAELAAAGFPVSSVPADRLELVANGRPVPLLRLGGSGTTLAPTDTLVFVGRRNRAGDETWALSRIDALSSPFYSLYTDTTTYWLRDGGGTGLRYAGLPAVSGAAPVQTLRDTVHVEPDLVAYQGDSNESGHPWYTRGEGLYAALLSMNASTASASTTLSLSFPSATRTDSVTVEVRVNGGSASGHHATLVAVLAGREATLADVVWTGYQFQTLRGTFAASELPASGTLTLRIAASNEMRGDPNHVYVDYARATYLRTLDAAAGRVRFRAAAGPVQATLGGFAASGAVVALAPDAAQWAALTGTGSARTVAGTLDAASEVWAVERSRLQAPTRIASTAARTPLALDPDGADYVIITNGALRESAEAHAAYHANVHGRRVRVIDQSRLFDEFDYGRPTPIAIRRFVRAMRAWPRAPQYLLFWGDALAASRTRPVAPWEAITFGDAPSDAWFAMQTAGLSDLTESVAIGRVPARTNADGTIFTAKLQRYEATAPAPWQRRSVHVSGGYSDSERALLASYQRSWMGIERARPTRLDTTLLLKTNSNVVDVLYRDRLGDEFEDGMLWFAYFSHSSPQTWEVEAPPPEEWNNAARLPIVLSLGCRTGAFTLGTAAQATRSLAEALLIGSANGGIAHWGTSELSGIAETAMMADAVHRLAFTDTMRVLGPLFREAKRRVATYSSVPPSGIVRNLMQYALIGDPATQMVLARGPEFRVEAGDLAFDAPVEAGRHGTLRVRFHDDGLLPSDSVDVALAVRVPDGTTLAFDRRIRFDEDSAFVEVAFAVPDAGGELAVTAEIDPRNQTTERTESDNRVARTFYVFSRGIALADPALSGITGTAPVLRVTPLSVTPTAVPVVFEIDTVRTFTSAARRTYRTSATVVGEWAQSGLEPGRTYYWRARVDEPEQADRWAESRFTVRPDLTDGFFAQNGDLTEGGATTLVRASDGSWTFPSALQEIDVTSERGSGTYIGKISIGASAYIVNTLGWGVVIVDGRTGQVRHAGSYPTYAISAANEARFGTNETKARAQLDSVSRTLRDGDLVLMRTRHLGNVSGSSAVSATDRASLARLGATKLDSLAYNRLWLMVHRVGSGEHYERLLNPVGENSTVREIVYKTSAVLAVTSGTLTTAATGPALRWGLARADVALAPTARASVSVLAAADTLIRAAPVNAPIDLSSINARLHPSLRLHIAVRDSTGASVPQIRSAYVLFERVPDLTLDGTALALSADSVAENEPLRVTVPVVHLGSSGTTDALVHYVVVDAANREHRLATDTLRALAPGSRTSSTATLATAGLAGRNRLRVSVEQPGLAEMLTSNNVALTAFSVVPDQTRPSFSVRIDGEAAPNDPSPVANLQDPRYPLVSARPTIEILIRDGNAFKPIADTSAARLTLDGKTLRFSQANVVFEPATAARPEARIVLTPDFSADADDETHTLALRIFDASGNEAEGSPYQVHFRVTRETAVEAVLPYPNPMRDRTTFAFRLRGADAAAIEALRLRIYTVAGALVREFDLVDDPTPLAAGAVRIGWNRLRWDGTDADGDLLAPGVYLYRVEARAAGEALTVENASRIERLVIVR